jgi:hypothetical protein
MRSRPMSQRSAPFSVSNNRRACRFRAIAIAELDTIRASLWACVGSIHRGELMFG